MGLQQSKDALLHQQASCGDVDAVRALRSAGAGLEYVDKEGKTPLMVACMKPGGLPIVEALIELGANDTMLEHHCIMLQKKDWSRSLMFFSLMEVAQPRDIISLWKAKLDELNFNQPDPVVAIIDLSTKKRYRFLSAREGDKQQILWFYNACRGVSQGGLLTNSLNQVDESYLSSQATASATTSAFKDEQLGMAISASLQSAIAEGIHHFSDAQPPSHDSSNNGWGDSDSSTFNGWGPPDRPSLSTDITNGWSDEAVDDGYNGWAVQESGPSTSSQSHNNQNNESVIISPAGGVSAVISTPSNDKFNGWATSESVLNASSQSQQNHSHAAVSNPPAYSVSPSAPPLVDDTYVGGPIRYPSIDLSPVNYPIPEIEVKPGATEQKEMTSTSGLCIICLDEAVEGACIPCGHMAGCMSCLNEIKAKKWGCPVCRAKIDQVVRLYSV